MNNSYINAMDKITADEYMIREIVSAAGKKTAAKPKRRALKRIPAILIAAAIALSLGVVAYAANGNILSVIFGEGDYDELEGLTGKMDIRELKINHDGVSVTPKGCVTDGHKAYCVFRLDLEEQLPTSDPAVSFTDSRDHIDYGNFVYAMNESYREMSKQLSNQLNCGVGVWSRFKAAGDNSLYLILCIEFDDIVKESVDISFNCQSLGYTRTDDYKTVEYVECISESLFEAELTISMENAETIKLDPSGTKYANWDFTLTSCGVYVTGTFFGSVNNPFPSVFERYDHEQYILMKNGKKINIPRRITGGVAPSKEYKETRKEHRYSGMAEYPFNVKDAVALVVDGVVIPIAAE